MNYNCRALERSVVLDNTPDRRYRNHQHNNTTGLHSRFSYSRNCFLVFSTALLTIFYSADLSLDATLLGGNSCVTRDIKDTIHCLGGIKVLFPLFAQLSQPLVPSGTQQEINYAPDPALAATVLAVLRDMLGGK